MNKLFIGIMFSLAAILLLASMSLFIVDQREQAIVLQLGQPVGETRGPGLHVKIPFIQNVQYFDSRILSVDPPTEQVVISSDRETQALRQESDEDNDAESDVFMGSSSGEPIIVDTFARYKIVDPLQFYKTLRTTMNANSRLENILNDATRTVLGRTTLKRLLSAERTTVMADISSRVNNVIKNDKLGIALVDVRIVRADLTSDLRTSTVRRMISELQERATETRAEGEERALEIRSTAEKERTVLIAEAEREAQILRGEGDNEAIKIYAEAFNKDQEFYSFFRSMEAYKTTLSNPETRLILSPDSEFFRYFKQQGGN